MKNLVLLLLVAVAFARLESVHPFPLRKLPPTRSLSALTSEALLPEILSLTFSEMLCQRLLKSLWDSAEEIWSTTDRVWNMREAPSTESSQTSWFREEILLEETAPVGDQFGDPNSMIKTLICSMSHSASQWRMLVLIQMEASFSSQQLRLHG